MIEEGRAAWEEAMADAPNTCHLYLSFHCLSLHLVFHLYCHCLSLHLLIVFHLYCHCLSLHLVFHLYCHCLFLHSHLYFMVGATGW